MTMRPLKRSLRHGILVVCLFHSSANAFLPTPTVRLTPIGPKLVEQLPPTSTLPPPTLFSIPHRRRHRHRTSTQLHLTPSASLSWLYMSLLALQFGCQPLLTRKFVPKSVTRSTVVLFQEVVKFIVAAIFLWASGSWTSSLGGKSSLRLDRPVVAGTSFSFVTHCMTLA